MTALGLGPWLVACVSVLGATSCGTLACYADAVVGSSKLQLWLLLSFGFFLVCVQKWMSLLRSGEGVADMYDTQNLSFVVLGGAALSQFLDMGFLKQPAKLLPGGIRVGEADSASIAAPLSFYLCSYMATQVLVMMLKTGSRRIRPGVALAEELASVRRALPPLSYLNVQGYTVYESFPSGDAAGAPQRESSVRTDWCALALPVLTRESHNA
eukprot:scaffold645_cov247-Pinguiococcus_pyrenoidosus.AAC.32